MGLAPLNPAVLGDGAFFCIRFLIAGCYEDLKSRGLLIKENINDLRQNRILADGDREGCLLQIFIKNVIGSGFYEIIQRRSHEGFGEGNFQALFDAIERDQIQRGCIK